MHRLGVAAAGQKLPKVCFSSAWTVLGGGETHNTSNVIEATAFVSLVAAPKSTGTCFIATMHAARLLRRGRRGSDRGPKTPKIPI